MPLHPKTFVEEVAAATLQLQPRWQLFAYDCVSSTMDKARCLLSGIKPPFAVWAREQTAGRGRMGRTWQGAEGNLAVTFMLAPKIPVTEWPLFSLLASLAVRSCLLKCGLPEDLTVALKWPNDVLVGGAKIAGILLETENAGVHGTQQTLSIGIGINVAAAPEDTPYPAIALSAFGIRLSAAEVLVKLGQSLSEWIDLWKQQGGAWLRAEWQKHAYRWQENVTLSLGGETVTGRFCDLHESGAMTIELENGQRRILTAGEWSTQRLTSALSQTTAGQA